MKALRNKTLIIVALQLLVASLHALHLKSYLSAPWDIYYSSWFSDVLIPFGFYFLLCLNDMSLRILKPWYVKAAIIFLLCTTSEVLQFYGIYAFGVTFDWLDILAYCAGVLLAALVERKLFARLSFWNITTLKESNQT
jgi:hypothetical protein